MSTLARSGNGDGLDTLDPTITVVICTWNRAAVLEATLRTLRAQSGIRREAIECVVVDNNSVDGTRALVEGLAKDWPLGRLVYAFEPRQGKQFALNRAVQLASSEVLAFTDDDIDLPPNWLLEIRRLFADKSVDLAGGKTLIGWGDHGKPGWFATDMLAVMGGVDLGDEQLAPAPPGYAPGGGNLIARRALFDAVGLFSETHFRHMDYEFGMRCQQRGVRIIYEPRLVVQAPVDERCLTKTYFRHWAFKAGISRSGGIDAAGRRPSVERWIYRQLIEDVWTHFSPGGGADEAQRFSRELRMWRGLGTVSNAWHGWLRPATHAAWVEQRSQKKDGLYV